MRIGGFFGGSRINMTPTIRIRFKDRFTSEFSYGYNKVELSKMNSDDIAKTINDRGAMFNPKLDKEGFQIMLRDDYGGPGEGEELDSNA